MEITVKSIPENFEKEKLDKKRATIRQLDGNDILKIKNKETGEIVEKRITDISVWKEWIIISW